MEYSNLWVISWETQNKSIKTLPDKPSKWVLLQHHNYKFSMDAVDRNGHEIIQQPAYSSDFESSDYLLFSSLKTNMSFDAVSCPIKKDKPAVEELLIFSHSQVVHACVCVSVTLNPAGT